MHSSSLSATQQMPARSLPVMPPDLASADLALVPIQSQVWTKAVHAARLTPMPLAERWQGLWESLILPQAPELDRDFLEALMACGCSIAQQVERDMTMAAWPYHNAAHIQDTLLLSAHLLAAWEQGDLASEASFWRAPDWSACDAGLLLLACLVHDWGHDGSPVTSSPTLEALACARLDVCWTNWTATPAERWHGAGQVIRQVVLATQASAVHALHDQYGPGSDAHQRSQTVPMLHWLSLLMTEADVGASLLPHAGLWLTQCVQQEWHLWAAEMPSARAMPVTDLVALRRRFLTHVRLSSFCARRIGLQHLLQQGLAFP